MPHKLAPYITALLLACITCAGQVSQDPQAVAEINTSINASGGIPAISAISDFTATGNITYYWATQNVQGTVTLKALGTSNFRSDAVLPSGTQSWAVTNNSGTLVDTAGTRTTIPFYNAVNIGILSWRMPNLIAALSNSSATISYLGSVQSDAGQAIQVHFQVTDPTNPDPSTATFNTIDYFFDPTTNLLIESIDTTYPSTNFSNGLPHEIVYSNYQNVDGVMIPFSVVEKISNQETWSVQLTGISFNTGLALSDFQL